MIGNNQDSRGAGEPGGRQEEDNKLTDKLRDKLTDKLTDTLTGPSKKLLEIQ